MNLTKINLYMKLFQNQKMLHHRNFNINITFWIEVLLKNLLKFQ